MRKLYMYPLTILTMLAMTGTAAMADSFSIELNTEGAALAYNGYSADPAPVYVVNNVRHVSKHRPSYSRGDHRKSQHYRSRPSKSHRGDKRFHSRSNRGPKRSHYSQGKKHQPRKSFHKTQRGHRTSAYRR